MKGKIMNVSIANAFINYEMGVCKMKIKNEVKELRLFLGLTQAQFAKRIGVSESAVKQWESGRCFPSPSNMKQIILLKELLSAGVAVEMRSSRESFSEELIKKVYNKYLKEKLN